jgi:hypothetical protein
MKLRFVKLYEYGTIEPSMPSTGMARHGFLGFGFFKNPVKPTMGLMGLISSVGIAQR